MQLQLLLFISKEILAYEDSHWMCSQALSKMIRATKLPASKTQGAWFEKDMHNQAVRNDFKKNGRHIRDTTALDKEKYLS